MKKAAVIPLTFVILLLGSCATAPLREDIEADRLVGKLEDYNRTVSSVRGEAVGIFREGDDMSTFRLEVASRWPSSDLRLDIRDFVFKKHVLTLAKSGEDILILIHLREEYIALSDEELDFEDLSGLPLRKEILIPTLMGRVPVSGYSSFAATSADTLLMQGTGVSCVVRFDRDLSYPQKVRYDFDGAVYEVTFSKHRTHPDDASHYFPHWIGLEHGEKRLELSYSTLTLNIALDDRLFALSAEEYGGYGRVQ
jgi:hypothetical protein